MKRKLKLDEVSKSQRYIGQSLQDSQTSYSTTFTRKIQTKSTTDKDNGPLLGECP